MHQKNGESEALEYHSRDRPGKLATEVTKPVSSQRDLSLAYTPGVAEPVRRIAEDPGAAYDYTARGNLVGVISNGSAVLGLGDVGALAGKPVMEGKAVLFKRFADIDVFDLEIEESDPDRFVETVAALEPTFGGINLEDIRAPECFRIEKALKERMKIPVFHDDQHGTAIIAGAALLNACELSGRSLPDLRLVISGAGASALASAAFFIRLGLDPDNLMLSDSEGVLHSGRLEQLNEFQRPYARETDHRTISEALEGADAFIGLSAGNIVDGSMIKAMNEHPILFPLANPDPEIPYEEALEARPDAILATGRSDYPNQVNNVLGFPFIFRGALDVRARAINEAMKVAAARALADLAKTDVPDAVLRAYGLERLKFSDEYLIPKAHDPRILTTVAPAVALAAMESGAAGRSLDIDAYREELNRRFGRAREIKRIIINKATSDPKRIVYSEGEEAKIIRAASIVKEEGIGHPVLLGDPETVHHQSEELGFDTRLEVLNPLDHPARERYVEKFYALRQRRGITRRQAEALMKNRNYFGAMMLHQGDVDAFVAGVTYHYPEVLRPALQIIKPREGRALAAGLYIMVIRDKTFFFTDATVNIEPSAEELAEIAVLAADAVRRLGITPRVAMLSFSNFGSTRHPLASRVIRATRMVQRKHPELIIDGEMQADTAVVGEILRKDYPFSLLKSAANVLVFPDLEAANIAYKLLQRLGGADAIGPILMGTARSVHVLQRGDDVEDIVSISAMAVLDAQELEEAEIVEEVQQAPE